MLRDLYLGGNREFVSDIDFVVNAISPPELEAMVQKLGGRRNRFGGYGLTLNRWRVDVWPLQKTWAAVQGHVEVKEFNDLLKVTFFDWDAVLYEVREKRIICEEGYFERLNSRMLDVNLEPNPNPLGNAVRALRYAWRWDASFGPRVAHHVYLQLAQHGWGRLIEAERASFVTRVLDHIDHKEISEALRAFDAGRSSCPIRLHLSPEQRKLALES